MELLKKKLNSIVLNPKQVIARQPYLQSSLIADYAELFYSELVRLLYNRLGGMTPDRWKNLYRNSPITTSEYVSQIKKDGKYDDDGNPIP